MKIDSTDVMSNWIKSVTRRGGTKEWGSLMSRKKDPLNAQSNHREEQPPFFFASIWMTFINKLVTIVRLTQVSFVVFFSCLYLILLFSWGNGGWKEEDSLANDGTADRDTVAVVELPNWMRYSLWAGDDGRGMSMMVLDLRMLVWGSKCSTRVPGG